MENEQRVKNPPRKENKHIAIEEREIYFYRMRSSALTSSLFGKIYISNLKDSRRFQKH